MEKYYNTRLERKKDRNLKREMETVLVMIKKTEYKSRNLSFSGYSYF